MKVIIIMGSKGDLEHCQKIGGILKKFAVGYIFRIASAHKTPEKALAIIREYEEDAIFITVAGRSNALSGFVDANTKRPVIAAPPYHEIDIFSSLRMPSGVAPLVVIDPEGAALATIKILALSDKSLEEKLKAYQKEKAEEIEKADLDLDFGRNLNIQNKFCS
ncbi:AIR carboxylase family protein [bacterium]|nr:AIR carboxylase family protein [bacterium]